MRKRKRYERKDAGPGGRGGGLDDEPDILALDGADGAFDEHPEAVEWVDLPLSGGRERLEDAPAQVHDI